MIDTDRTYFSIKGQVGNIRINGHDENSRYGKIVNVYYKVLPRYELSEVQPESSCLVLEKLSYIEHLECNYYLFPLKTRKKTLSTIKI